MQLQKTLEEIGLTKNEVTIYLYLLSHGQSLGSTVYKDCIIDKSAAYKALASLEDKGLIQRLSEARNKEYKITSAQKVQELFDSQIESLNRSKNALQEAFKNIEQYSTDYYQRENVEIYTGFEAHNVVSQEMLKGNVKVIRSIENSEVIADSAGSKKELAKIYDWFIPARVKKEIKIRVLRADEKEPLEYQLSNPDLLKECRIYPRDIELPATLTLFGNRVCFQTIKRGEYWAIIIKDPLISALLVNIFDDMWSQSKIA